MLKRKRTQAFTATKDKRVKAIIKQNAETPLLRLPLELRKSIWHYLLGDRTIHIKFAPTHRWEEKIRCRGPARSAFKGHFTYIVCEANISEQAACDMFENGASDMKAAEKDTVMDTGLCRNRHADCYACYDDCLDKNYVMYDKNVGKPIDLERLRRNRMHLDILRVCRQAYIEANSVLWGSSLWSFTHSLAFSKFMEYRNAVQRREMKTCTWISTCAITGYSTRGLMGGTACSRSRSSSNSLL